MHFLPSLMQTHRTQRPCFMQGQHRPGIVCYSLYLDPVNPSILCKVLKSYTANKSSREIVKSSSLYGVKITKILMSADHAAIFSSLSLSLSVCYYYYTVIICLLLLLFAQYHTRLSIASMYGVAFDCFFSVVVAVLA